jgi:serine phosphatase RsbU (regulator of sigma subunit)
MSARVVVEPPDKAPFERDLDAQEIIVGRGATAGIVVPDSSVSRQHAKLFQRDGRWWAEDLGATNGTLLNDKPLTKATVLEPGDRLKVGGSTLRFLPASIAPATPIAPPPATGGIAATGPAAVPGDRQAARFATLNEIHRALATPISLTELLELILQRSFAVLHPEEGVILLKQPDGTFKPAASRGSYGSSGNVLISRRLVDEVAGKQKPALVLDAALDERFAGSQSIVAAGVRSVVAAPLCDAEGTMGLIALTSRASVRQFAEADLDLLMSLASAAALRVRNVALTEEAAARRVLERELALAHDMQMAMLPRGMPDRPEIRMAAALTPARSVGGDLYDFVADDEGLWFLIADVSGKGVAAALYVAVLKTLFRVTVQTQKDLAEILRVMNHELGRDNDQMMFVTAIIGRLVFDTGQISAVDAGHNPAFVVGSRGDVTATKLEKSIALGVDPDAVFKVSGFRLDAGSTLLLYTDGATDARNTAGEIFGADRLQRAVAGSLGRTATDLVHATVKAVSKFAAGAPPEDDLTLLAIEYLGTEVTHR